VVREPLVVVGALHECILPLDDEREAIVGADDLVDHELIDMRHPKTFKSEKIEGKFDQRPKTVKSEKIEGKFGQ
jgi:hypothetical protein